MTNPFRAYAPPTKFFAAAAVLTLTASAFAFTKSGNTYSTDGTQSDVAAAITAASPNDTIMIPEGTFTWGAARTYVSISKPITLSGAGPAKTTIVFDATGPTGTSAVLRIGAAATVRDFTIKGASSVAAFSVGSTSGWRITNITYTPGATAAYFCYINGSYGIIDNCDITGASGTNELIFGRGPSDSWQTPNSIGRDKNVFIEDCTFRGQGYVCDANANARFVVRYCTITGPMKVDGHGMASNSPPRGVRHMEVYGNRWLAPAGVWAAMELRGGSGMVFNNDSLYESGVTVKGPSLKLRDYFYISSNYSDIPGYATAYNYPVGDQIGVGMDPKRGGSEPYYIWSNTRGGNDWGLATDKIEQTGLTGKTDATGYPIGATVITLTSCTYLNSPGNAGDYCAFEGDPNRYMLAVDKGSGAGTITLKAPGLLKAIPAAATNFKCGPIEKYQAQVSNASATYGFDDVIKADRDYFKGTTGVAFTGSGGVGVGTKLQMQAIRGLKEGVAFWASDDGEWNSKNAGPDGRLYVWNGTGWAPKYIPFPYPHPMRSESHPISVRSKIWPDGTVNP